MTYINFKDLKTYQLARKISNLGWEIFLNLTWEAKKIVGFQFIESTDSSGANIAEGYRRYHFLDQIKFYYTAWASLSEANDHWLDLLYERNKVNKGRYDNFKEISKNLEVKLNNFIAVTYKTKNNIK